MDSVDTFWNCKIVLHRRAHEMIQQAEFMSFIATVFFGKLFDYYKDETVAVQSVWCLMFNIFNIFCKVSQSDITSFLLIINGWFKTQPKIFVLNFNQVNELSFCYNIFILNCAEGSLLLDNISINMKQSAST